MCFFLFTSIYFCYKGCYPERNGFGFLVTTNGIGVSGIANYSCWPGYTYVNGNMTRTCLSTLLWSGRRPNCILNCTSLITQKCIQCQGEIDENSVCSFDKTSTVASACFDKLDSATPSVAIVGTHCYEYTCKHSIKGVSSTATDWTARYTCTRGTVCKHLSLLIIKTPSVL